MPVESANEKWRTWVGYALSAAAILVLQAGCGGNRAACVPDHAARVAATVARTGGVR